MNIAEWSIRKSLITWVMTVLFLVAGWSSYQQLSRLEDPEFTIKDAVITTPYPGASAAEVEEEVTNVIEKAAQQMGQIKRVESRSSRGLSWVKVSMQDRFDKNALPQVWDELRRKINDAQRFLPPGAGPSLVNDDFGDVYGIYYAITGDGYSYKEIYEYAKMLQRELLAAKDVKRIVLYGVQNEAVFIKMRREKMAQLGISPQDIYAKLKSKNLATNSGNLLLGEEFIPISPTGEFRSEQEFGDLLITSPSVKSTSLVYLRDVAEIKRDYQDPPSNFVTLRWQTSHWPGDFHGAGRKRHCHVRLTRSAFEGFGSAAAHRHGTEHHFPSGGVGDHLPGRLCDKPGRGGGHCRRRVAVVHGLAFRTDFGGGTHGHHYGHLHLHAGK
jgi:multidrug efflux pump subunit AcrB